MKRFTVPALAAAAVIAGACRGPASAQAYNPYPNSDPSRVYGAPPNGGEPGRGGPFGQHQRRSYGEDRDRRNTYGRSDQSDRYNLHPPSYGYPQDRYNNQQYNNNNGQFGLAPANRPDSDSDSRSEDAD